ncbi:HipA family kinase [Acidipila sp. EB88]|uniref:HipA family kinase n=1 Tax=Acidipila sp. EB88 TaxID=2305226 RepID=UPI0035179E3E
MTALQQIRKMRGGAQSHLMLGSDGHAYVVKFQNNPQHLRVLVGEMLGTRLAAALGLTVPHCDVVEVSEWLIGQTRELTLDLRDQVTEPCRAGLQFGSRLVGGLMPGQTVDYLPETQLAEVKNLAEFAGMLVLDKWTCNANGRQAVFHKRPRQKRYEATFIDQGYCCNAGDWTLNDAPLRGVYARNLVYAGVTGWQSFEPWMSRLEKLDPQAVWGVAEGIPPEWYGGAMSELEQLVERLLERRTRVPELIGAFRESSRQPFPNWMRGEAEIKKRLFVEPRWTM